MAQWNDEENQTGMNKNKDSDNSVKNERKKKSIIPKIFGNKWRHGQKSDDELYARREIARDLERRLTTPSRPGFLDAPLIIRKSFSERHTSERIKGLDLSSFQRPLTNFVEVQDFRIFVATWNVGGKPPNNGLNLEDFLQIEGSSDIYILGFQEIVPLNAGNVLVIEDNEPAAKWLSLISQALNRPHDQNKDDSTHSNTESNGSKHGSNSKDSKSGHLFFQKPSLKVMSKNFRIDDGHLKTCNCRVDSLSERSTSEISESMKENQSCSYSRDDSWVAIASSSHLSYCLVASKQMVGIFLSVWVRTELIPHVAHLRISCLGRGIMGCFGNKGCISMSMTLHQTTFCFVCSHLASGEKEGDELRRNSDVSEILRSTHFPKICRVPGRRMPEKILEHERIIWLGDLNYRIALSYEETRSLLEENDWDALLEKDQLKIEREEGRVFTGWNEGKIFFAPTYKYTLNSDAYAGETAKSKKKRRTPAWCDRILWYGEGLEQLSYIRGESRFSDHRPVCAVFVAEVEMSSTRGRKGYSSAGNQLELQELVPQRHSFCD